MTSKFGANGDQVVAFVAAVERQLPDFTIDAIADGMFDETHTDAKARVLKIGMSASRHSAMDSAIRKLVMSVKTRMPRPTTTGERLTGIRVMTSLAIAVQALTVRPELDDETVGLVVDPFASLIEFEWRSWGVSSQGDLGGAPAGPSPV